MPGSITSDQLLVDPCDAWNAAIWATIGSFTTGPSAVDDYRIQGTYCLRGRLSASVRGWAHAIMPGAGRVHQYDASPAGYVDITTAFNNAATADIIPWPATEAAGDQMQVGWAVPFGGMSIIISTAGIGGTLSWKYWNGNAWVALQGVTDGTNGLTAAAGTYTVLWTVPTDWVKVSINGSAKLFWIVAEVVTLYSTNPILSQGFLMYAPGADGYCLFIWENGAAPPSIDSWTNGGQRVAVSSDLTPTLTGTWPSSGPTNSRQWYVNGNDGLKMSGYVPYTIDPSVTGNLDLGSPILTMIRQVGIGFGSIAAMATGNFNVFWDVLRIGTGLIVVDGTSGSPVAFADIFGIDHAIATMYGVITQVAGIYYLNGKLYIGQADQANLTFFKDTNRVIVYRNFPVSAGFYEIRIVGLSGKTSTFQLGTYSAGVASSGCTIRGSAKVNAADPSPTTSTWTLTASDAYAVALLYGSVFSEMRRAFLNSAAEIRYSTFDNFGEIEINGAVLQNCVFKNVNTSVPISGTWALIVDAPAELGDAGTRIVKNNEFINCNRAIKITQAGTYYFDNLKFSGNTYDIDNTSGGAVIIVLMNGSNPDIAKVTGNTTFQTSVQLGMTVKNEAGAVIVGALAYIDNNDLSPFILNTTTGGDGKASVSYTGSPVTGARWRVRKYGYRNFKQIFDIGGADIDLPVTLVVDPQQS